MLWKIFFILLFFLFTPLPAYAYLDPGTGSYLTQLLMGLLFAAAYLIKQYWRKLKRIIQRIIKFIFSFLTKKNDST